MKILQIVQKPQRRGAEIFAYHFSEQLARAGHDVKNAYLYRVDPKDSLPLRTNDVAIDADENDFQERIPGWNLTILRKLQELIKTFQPQVVQANAARTVKYAALLHRFTGKTPWILIYRNIGDPQVWLKGKYRKWIYRSVLMPQVDGMVAISSESLSALRKIYNGDFLMKKIFGAVDEDTFKPSVERNEIRKKFNTPPESPLLIFAGSLTPEKRVDRLLRVMRECILEIPNLYLWILGDGILRSELEVAASQLGIAEHLRFLGIRDDVASIMNAADLLVLSSDTEGIPGVILEAGLLGIPSIAPRVGGIEDCIVDGETGILTEPKNEEALAQSVHRLISDFSLRGQMGTRAKHFIQQHFRMRNITEEYIRFYEDIMNQ